MTIRNLCLAGAAALAVGVAADDAHAFGVSPGDPGFIVNFNEQDTLLARLTFELDSVLNNVWTFAVEVANLSENVPDVNRIVAFGFNVSPFFAATIDDDDNGTWAGVSVPGVNPGPNTGGFEAINTCVFAGENCPGGANEGVIGGGTSNLVLLIETDGSADTLFFSNVQTRWQDINLPTGETSIAIGGDIAPIPLPPVGFMLLGALGALAFAARRRPVEKAAA